MGGLKGPKTIIAVSTGEAFINEPANPALVSAGTGDVLEPEEGIIGIGSGGNYALAAAKVLMETNMSAEDIAKKALKVASEICVFTNNNITTEKV